VVLLSKWRTGPESIIFQIGNFDLRAGYIVLEGVCTTPRLSQKPVRAAYMTAHFHFMAAPAAPAHPAPRTVVYIARLQCTETGIFGRAFSLLPRRRLGRTNAAGRPTKGLVDSQTSDVDSIPIVRSISLVDSLALTPGAS
jgi:hypothetical protein